MGVGGLPMKLAGNQDISLLYVPHGGSIGFFIHSVVVMTLAGGLAERNHILRVLKSIVRKVQ